MTGNYFDPPDKRWDPAYTVEDFIPQQPEAFTTLMGDSDLVAHHLDLARNSLGGLAVPSWKGAATRVFGDYITEIQGYVDSLRSSNDEARGALKTAAGTVSDARDDAGRAVTDLNELQTEHATATADDDDGNFFEKFADKLQDLPGTIVRTADFDAAYARADTARKDALKALEDLALALDSPDGMLSKLTVPEPPGVFSMMLSGLSPEEIQAMSALFGKVDKALDQTGQTATAQEAVSDARDAVGGSDDDKREWLRSLGDLSAAEQEWVLDHLDEDDLAAMLGGLDPNADRDIYNQLALHLPQDLQRRLADTDPNHYWHPATGDSGRYGWGDPSGIGDPLSGSTSELQQGGLGDCHVLASLAAMEQSDPGYLADHITPNANGTYTVTLYQDGEPIDVVVTPEFPFTVNDDGTLGSGAYSHGGTQSDQAWTDDLTTYMIYEKALAQVWGEVDPTGEGQSGYPGMDGGWPQDDMPVISNVEMDQNEPPSSVSFDDFERAYAGGSPVTLTTKFDPDDSANPLYQEDGDNQAVGGHVYYVIDIEGEPPDATVVLGNPWGSELPGTGTLRVSWDEVQDQFHSIQVGK